MKTLLLMMLFGLAVAQPPQNGLPYTQIQTLEGETLNSRSLHEDGVPILICVWAQYSTPGKLLLNELIEEYYGMYDATGVKVICVSIDAYKELAKVKALVRRNGWEYQMYLDPDQSFKEAMGVEKLPHIFLLDGSGEIVWHKADYEKGEYKEIVNEVMRLGGAAAPEPEEKQPLIKLKKKKKKKTKEVEEETDTLD